MCLPSTSNSLSSQLPLFPLTCLHKDLEPLATLQTPPANHSHLLEITSWDEETEFNYRGLIKDAQSKLKSNTELVHKEVYDALFNAYLDSDWLSKSNLKRATFFFIFLTMLLAGAKILCHLWLQHFPGKTQCKEIGSARNFKRSNLQTDILFAHLGDPIVNGLAQQLARDDFQCRQDWPGYHRMTEK